MWVMLPIVGGAAIAKKITSNKKTTNVTLSFNKGFRRKDDDEDDFEEEEEEDDDFENILSRAEKKTTNDDNDNKRRRRQKPFEQTGEKSSIDQLLPSINVEEILSSLKKENFALECELGMMSATLEEETLRADALEED